MAALLTAFCFWMSIFVLSLSEQESVNHNAGGVPVNDMQRQQILRLRQAGRSFAQIADEVHLSKSTVKSFCYRHHDAAPKAEPAPSSPVCPQCGQPLPSAPFRPRRFCTDACRAKYWMEHSDQINRRSAVKTTCPVCHRSFVDYAQRHRKYCSHACYIAARYHGGEIDD